MCRVYSNFSLLLLTTFSIWLAVRCSAQNQTDVNDSSLLEKSSKLENENSTAGRIAGEELDVHHRNNSSMSPRNVASTPLTIGIERNSSWKPIKAWMKGNNAYVTLRLKNFERNKDTLKKNNSSTLQMKIRRPKRDITDVETSLDYYLVPPEQYEQFKKTREMNLRNMIEYEEEQLRIQRSMPPYPNIVLTNTDMTTAERGKLIFDSFDKSFFDKILNGPRGRPIDLTDYYDRPYWDDEEEI